MPSIENRVNSVIDRRVNESIKSQAKPSGYASTSSGSSSSSGSSDAASSSQSSEGASSDDSHSDVDPDVKEGLRLFLEE